MKTIEDVWWIAYQVHLNCLECPFNYWTEKRDTEEASHIIAGVLEAFHELTFPEHVLVMQMVYYA